MDKLPHIEIISGSVRSGRNSHRVALFFKGFIESRGYATAQILDLKEYNFPIFDERLRFQQAPTQQMLEYSSRINEADAVILITPEYNGGYPASVKNAIDFLYPEWQKKPMAISTVSTGNFGGAQVITSLQFTLWKMHALVTPAMFPVPNVKDAFDEEGNASDQEGTNKRADGFIKELLWLEKACRLMKQQDS
ncbi:MAG: NADPH-dependent oxidoreductase [Bacteroidetes bacterium]|nr:MAG: NADPH-dependent oxidoreductase [Bacteroidota bacterium]REK03414.1 MAG: NADPH-dependent oxidoreductase [Bacteroidota bacterium]REK34474.1 MAG: NADPH-dependent oxidoreductase [Bacteroidota bacterium]REK50408.1 MAG: NADPH-dependent oxidoreductase [Bacteroidota bacterium]